MTEVELLLEIYKIQVSRSEHFEKLRFYMSGLILTLAVALLGVVSLDSPGGPTDALVGIAIAALGSFGFVASLLHSKRAERHGTLAGKYREQIDRLMPSAGFDATHSAVRAEYRQTHLNRLWAYLHLLIIGSGLLVAVLAIITTGPPE